MRLNFFTSRTEFVELKTFLVIDFVLFCNIVLCLAFGASEIDYVSFTFFCHSVDYIRPVNKIYWSRERDSNPRPAVYKTAALPLSYPGLVPGGGADSIVAQLANSFSGAEGRIRTSVAVKAPDLQSGTIDRSVTSAKAA